MVYDEAEMMKKRTMSDDSDPYNQVERVIDGIRVKIGVHRSENLYSDYHRKGTHYIGD